MSTWNLDLFTSAIADYESAQYRILNNLQQARRDFSNNRIYPHLGQLVAIYNTLQTIADNSDSLKGALPASVKDVDLEAGEVIYERPDLERDEIKAIEEVIQWALPKIQDAIDEGTTIFEFVDDHLRLEEVGIVPSYIDEGYLFVPDHGDGHIHILRYTVSIFMGANERYRSLRTSHVKSVEHTPLQMTPQSIKLSLMEERKDLPNPATYSFDFELDFPYESTVLPVAKRKLMRYLCTDEGIA